MKVNIFNVSIERSCLFSVFRILNNMILMNRINKIIMLRISSSLPRTLGVAKVMATQILIWSRKTSKLP